MALSLRTMHRSFGSGRLLSCGACNCSRRLTTPVPLLPLRCAPAVAQEEDEAAQAQAQEDEAEEQVDARWRGARIMDTPAAAVVVAAFSQRGALLKRGTRLTATAGGGSRLLSGRRLPVTLAVALGFGSLELRLVRQTTAATSHAAASMQHQLPWVCMAQDAYGPEC